MDQDTTNDRSGDAQEIDLQLERISRQRASLLARHQQKLTGLMGTREDLRGVHAMADFVDDAVRWTA